MSLNAVFQPYLGKDQPTSSHQGLINAYLAFIFMSRHHSINTFRSLAGPILCLLMLCNFNTDIQATNDSDTSETIYVRKYKDRFSVKSIITQKFFDIRFEDLDANLPRVEYAPNLGPFLGFGLYAFDLGLELHFRLPTSGTSAQQYGRSKGTDLQARIYSRRFGLDATYQDYTGFYLKNPENFYPEWTTNDPYPQFKNMRVSIMNFGFFYVFNPRRYSFPAIHNHNEQQIKSAGSPLLTALVNLSNMSSDSGFIPDSDTNVFTGATGLNNISNNTLALLPGYGYNLIIKKNLYVSLSVAIGAGYQTRQYESDASYSDSRFGLATNWRFGMGYNNRNFFSGFSVFLQQNNAQFQNIRVINEIGFVRVFFGYRFKEFGVLKRSINEIFPFFESKL